MGMQLQSKSESLHNQKLHHYYQGHYRVVQFLVRMFLRCLTLLLAVACLAKPQYDLPAGADTILTDPVNTDFNCVDRSYGYYADVNNNCQLFHICLPTEDDEGNIIDYQQWTFLCGNGTLFDQQTLTCNYVEDAFPCEEAEQLYGSIQFGLLPDEIRRI